MSSQQIQQLKEDIHNQHHCESDVASENDVNSEDKTLDSESSTDLNAEDKALDLESSTDLNTNDLVEEQEVQGVVASSLPGQKKIKTCGFDEDGYMICK